MSIPPFMLALIVMFLVVMHGNQSVGGLFSPAFIDQPWSIAKVLDLFGHLWVPVVIIGSAGTASLIRIVRANMLDVLGQQFVTTARAKGLRESLVVYKHALRVAINPLISIIGLTLPRIIEGEALAAIVMNLPTTGPVYLRALQTLDMYLAGTFLMFLAAFLVLGNLAADVLLAVADPRIRFE
jgi:peptide/nickel transport system permease protein